MEESEDLAVSRFIINGMIRNSSTAYTYEKAGRGKFGEQLIIIDGFPCPRCKTNLWFLCPDKKGQLASCHTQKCMDVDSRRK